jgi:hypothetical protein
MRFSVGVGNRNPSLNFVVMATANSFLIRVLVTVDLGLILLCP